MKGLLIGILRLNLKPHLQAVECNKTVKVSNKTTLTNIVLGEQPDSCADDSVPEAKLIQAQSTLKWA